jgi:hypothetical protein
MALMNLVPNRSLTLDCGFPRASNPGLLFAAGNGVNDATFWVFLLQCVPSERDRSGWITLPLLSGMRFFGVRDGRRVTSDARSRASGRAGYRRRNPQTSASSSDVMATVEEWSTAYATQANADFDTYQSTDS